MKIAVITPTYNRKELLQETMKSLSESVLAPFDDIKIEHVIFDNGSTDDTYSLFTKPVPNTTYIREQENKGPSYARNKAIKQTDCDYIFTLDSDDIILQRSLYNFAKVAKENPNIDWFVADFLKVDNELRYIGNDYYGWNFKDGNEMLEAIYKSEHYIQGNVFFKKALFEKVGGYDETIHMAEDLDLYIRFIKNGGMPMFCPFVSHLHRHHSNNLSHGMTKEKHRPHIEKLKQKYDV